MKNFYVVGWLVLAAAAVHQNAAAQTFTSEQIQLGSDTYARHCSACHGVRMEKPEGAFDLKIFPPDQPERFQNSVAKGRNSMPPWDGLLKPEEINALWAYVVAGEKK